MSKKLLLVLYSMFCLVFISHVGLKASEDTLVIDDTPNSIEKTSISQINLSQAYSKAFEWIYSTAIITSYFDDGSFRQGFGLLLKDGFYLTSSELTYNAGLYPKKILAKMQDDSAKPLICIAQLRLKAMDSNKGLALLKTTAFTDDYCNVRSESYYHKRIYDKYGKNIFSPTPTKKLINNGIYFPILEDVDTFGVGKIISFQESNQPKVNSKTKSYGYFLPSDAYGDFTFGKPYFSKNGEFLGIFSVIENPYTPILIKKEIVQDFICELKKKNIFIQRFLPNSCKNGGA
ncbi:hypothetical protein [Helicobacter sp. 11S03491-1]|uniref:hypothetical protein n=1 Tax=Helicobacter sp. 11S03491-1 TaxID=1476196 RepID=UPI000BA7ADFB|nr:hypothetical protein [Helicobacter sp. 11S03491-1]PAF41730.1 hypothetical protein BKH45_06485 [Helicobacter sp. 11S03491-1]